MSTCSYNTAAKTHFVIGHCDANKIRSAIHQEAGLSPRTWTNNRWPYRGQEPPEDYEMEVEVVHSQDIDNMVHRKADSEILWSLMTPLSHNQSRLSLQEK